MKNKKMNMIGSFVMIVVKVLQKAKEYGNVVNVKILCFVINAMN